jgi:2-polyprenyl-6-methoxyphenol hydroxylase-like FAD-dependent oxidoreductase
MTDPVDSAFAILGAGPVALACALRCARLGPVMLLASGLAMPPARPPWIEVVPRAAIAGLLELGVPPHAVGVLAWSRRRAVAWDRPEPTLQESPEAAHLERPALERALLTLVHRDTRIEIRTGSAAALRAEALRSATLGQRVIDATGRSAALATRVLRPPKPWVARVFHVPGQADRVAPGFMLAALPQGYVYRAAGRQFTTIGVVGRGSLIAGPAAAVRDRLLSSDANWLVRDVTRRDWLPVAAKSASMQLASGDGVAFVGDAGLARDALSSQGLASGLRDACYAAAVRTAPDVEAIAERSRLQQLDHARAVTDMIRECRFRDAPLWAEYADYAARIATATQ